MTIYIALLRGINVGGHNKIIMAQLKSSLEQLALQNIRTYIQSGNIIFESNESEEDLQTKIQEKFHEDFDIFTTVVIRNAEQLLQIVRQCPFSEQKITEASISCKGECLHVALLPTSPTKANRENYLTYANTKELAVIQGRDIYLLFYDSIRNSKIGSKLDVLGVPATVRNWKTLSKLIEMVEEFY